MTRGSRGKSPGVRSSGSSNADTGRKDIHAFNEIRPSDAGGDGPGARRQRPGPAGRRRLLARHVGRPLGGPGSGRRRVQRDRSEHADQPRPDGLVRGGPRPLPRRLPRRAGAPPHPDLRGRHAGHARQRDDHPRLPDPRDAGRGVGLWAVRGPDLPVLLARRQPVVVAVRLVHVDAVLQRRPLPRGRARPEQAADHLGRGPRVRAAAPGGRRRARRHRLRVARLAVRAAARAARPALRRQRQRPRRPRDPGDVAQRVHRRALHEVERDGGGRRVALCRHGVLPELRLHGWVRDDDAAVHLVAGQRHEDRGRRLRGADRLHHALPSTPAATRSSAETASTSPTRQAKPSCA